jgi:hypothetical protein
LRRRAGVDALEIPQGILTKFAASGIVFLRACYHDLQVCRRKNPEDSGIDPVLIF